MGRVARFTPHRAATQHASNGEKAAGWTMTGIAFLLNGTPVRVAAEAPTRTLLDFLRETRGLCGTKEGCNEGDCGACTVMVTDDKGSRALNACILFLPQLHGKAVRTVEGLAGPKGEMHPVQEAMVTHHGSQCGFCTPGFVVSMAVGHMNGRRDHDDVLAGNLCRCTGYAPIIRAAEAAATAPVPDWMQSVSPKGPGVHRG
jgi:xanthine dehydrogenase small subunit